MEEITNACPTEILIDLKEDNDFIPSCKNYKEARVPLDVYKSMRYVENEENGLSEKKQERDQSILDMSPFRLRKEFSDPNISLNTNTGQVLKGAADDCPTAVLVDVPSSSNICPKKYCSLNKTEFVNRQENKLEKSLDQEIQGVKEQDSMCLRDVKKCSEMEDSGDCSKLFEMKNQVSATRLRWKTPSPQSMSRIRKEASEVIHKLNSSAIFDEGSLLCEEILPIPINFDLDDSTDEEDLLSSTENSCKNKLSCSVQIQDEVIDSRVISNEVTDICSLPVSKENSSMPEKNKKFPTESPSEPFDCQVNLKDTGDSNQYDKISKELSSSEIYSDYLDNSNFSTSNDGTDDVFITKSISSEDKENIPDNENRKILSKENKKILSKENKKILSKEIFMSSKITENTSGFKKNHRGTLRNLSNIKYEAIDLAKRASCNSKKEIATPCINFKGKTKEFQSPGTPQLKKTTSIMEHQTTSKRISFSDSFQHRNTRELVSGLQKPHSSMQGMSFLSNSVDKSSSSDVKHAFPKLQIPSKRHSISTPLKNISTKKPPLIPALSSFQNSSISKYTPKSVGSTRFSFSKSWQQSSKSFHSSNSKGLKWQNCMSVTSNITKPSFGGSDSSKADRQPISQNVSTLSCQISEKNAVSTSSKRRFCSKLSLPSPLFIEDRKLARALFPSASQK